MVTVSDETRIVLHFTIKEQANNESDEEPKFRCENQESLDHQYMIEELRMYAVNTFPKIFAKVGLIVSSGFRNFLFNIKCGGDPKSTHKDSRATDFNNIPENLYMDFAIEWLRICIAYNKIGGCEFGVDYIHFDSFSDKFGYSEFRLIDRRGSEPKKLDLKDMVPTVTRKEKTMDLKLRFKNKKWLITFLSAIVAFVYQMLGMFGIVPAISPDSIMQFLGILLNVLMALGILIDPTTKGISDEK